jgi:type II secretory pathway component PulM
MDGTTGAALQHIRRMETRIEQQNAVIVELRRAGKDTIEAANKLGLLHRALEEMRIQLLGLLPTEAQDRLRAAR